MSSAPNGNSAITAECCCPKKVKFFIFGNTWMSNYNTACPGVLTSVQDNQ